MDEKLACLKVLARVALLDGDPTPLEFEAFMDALKSFRPLPTGVTPEALLSEVIVLDTVLPHIQSPALQQQTYRGACTIAKSKGISLEEAALLKRLRTAFDLSLEQAKSLEKQARPPSKTESDGLINSALSGMNALIRREGDVRQTILDYSLGAAIVGLVPLNGGGTLEIKMLIVLGLILKMMWDIRKLWGNPVGQGPLAVLGNIMGGIGAIIAGLLAWGTVIGLGVVIPYVGSLAKAAGFATATWVAGQSTNQFYTSLKRPDVVALKRAFPGLINTPSRDI